MQPRARQSLALALWLAACISATCQTAASLHTQQTTLTFEAGVEAPRLRSMQGRDQEPWINLAREMPVSFVLVNGKHLPLHWRFNAAESVITRNRVVFVYKSESPKLRLTWEWIAPSASGPIEHQIHIANLSASEIWIPLQDSFRFNFKVDEHSSLKQLYIDKGAGRPTDTGTHEVAVTPGYRWQGLSSTYAEDGGTREIIPWFMVGRSNSDAGWHAGVEFSGRVSMTLERNKTSLAGVVGLNPEPEGFRTRLLPKQRFDTPKVFVGAFTEGEDGAGNILRPWIREALMNPVTWSNPSYPLVVNNSWGSGMAVNEALAKQMIRDSAELGLEMFHIDAGWFRGVGDWRPDPQKFPHGLAPIADDAHGHGLKFGIWVDWTQAALDTEPGALNVRDPNVHDWTVSDLPPDWKPEPFKGQTIDIGVSAAHDYAQR